MTCDETELITRGKQGDQEALEQLFTLYSKKVYRVAYGVVRKREDALDIVQEVFIKLFSSLKKFRGESNFYTYVYRMTINSSIDYIRKTRKSSASSFDGDLPSQVSDSPEKRPDSILYGKEIEGKIKKALDVLPEEQKATLILREVEGLSYEEISKVMRCSIGTVMSRLHYGRKRMKELLKEYIKMGETL